VAAQAINLADILKDVPPGAWAAIWKHRVVAFGADMQQVLADAHKHGADDPLIVKKPDRPETLFL